jgi:hypothetical protein
LRARLVMVTVAPGRTAPDGSLTMPPMLPYTAWAFERAGKRGTRSPHKRRTQTRRIAALQLDDVGDVEGINTRSVLVTRQGASLVTFG